METRAPYALIGLFMLAAIVAVFGFVYWLNNAAGLQVRTAYRVRFENTVSGLLKGAAVLFDGIRVGEVTDLRVDPQDPRHVTATIGVAADTPVRPDTQAGLEFQGLTGVPVITLQGGTPGPAWKGPAGELPLLVADPAAGQSMTQAARVALSRLDSILADNAEPLHSTITNLKTFTAALARNSDRLDGIVSGIEHMTGGGPEPPPKSIYSLSAAHEFPAFEKPLRGQLTIAEPTGELMFETQKILVRPPGAENPSFPNAQWSDTIPKLVQSRLVQSFENASFLGAVSRPMEGVSSDYQLVLDIRHFEILMSATPAADVELTARILRDGKIVGARIFHVTVPTRTADAAAAAAALDEAFGKVATEVVTWVAGTI